MKRMILASYDRYKDFDIYRDDYSYYVYLDGQGKGRQEFASFADAKEAIDDRLQRNNSDVSNKLNRYRVRYISRADDSSNEEYVDARNADEARKHLRSRAFRILDIEQV